MNNVNVKLENVYFLLNAVWFFNAERFFSWIAKELKKVAETTEISMIKEAWNKKLKQATKKNRTKVGIWFNVHLKKVKMDQNIF